MRAASIAAALSLAALARPAGACATAPPPGERVQIAEESAIIAWDAKTKVEHFVRRASFRAAGRDFGFLVPTPGKPDLAEVPDVIFDALEDLTKPEVIVQHRLSGVEPMLSCLFFALSRKGPMDADVAMAVRVLGEQRVAGYDAVVLEADSAGALAAWLKDHGYAQRPELAAWLAPYVAARWKLTAFKIAADGGAVRTGAVHMTFPAERPFYPYREPSDQRENLPASARVGTRLLRVFFFGAGRVDGAIGEARGPWPGKAVWSDRFDPSKLWQPLPVPVPEGAWLTMFEDKATPRPGTDDLFFAPAKDQDPVKPLPIVRVMEDKIPLPLDLLAIVGLAVWGVVRGIRRRRAST